MSRTAAPWLVRKAQRVWRRHVQLPYWTFACMWLQATNRFFWFKNAPDWVVNLFASYPDNGSGDDVERFFDAAWDERELRRRRRRIGAEAAK